MQFAPWPLRLFGRVLIGRLFLVLLSGMMRLFSPHVAFSLHQLAALLMPTALILGYWLARLAAVVRGSRR